MSVRGAELEAELLDRVCGLVRERMSGEQARLCQEFVRHLYHLVAIEDLAARDAQDLYGAAVAHWRLMEKRRPGELQVRVYNPDLEQDGWQSSSTVVELVSDDMPFIVDSLTMELVGSGYGLHLIIHPVMCVRRNSDGEVIGISDPGGEAPDARDESVVHVEIDREPDAALHEQLRERIETVMGQVRVAVEDWHPMRGRALALSDELAWAAKKGEREDLRQAAQFLRWLTEEHFTFLGYREYDLVEHEGATALCAKPDTGLGLLRGSGADEPKKLNSSAAKLARSPQPLVLTKANSHSPVHRRAYLDYVGVKRFDDDGNVNGERRFLGLYTTAAYRESAGDIPLLAEKVQDVVAHSGFPPESHARKALVEILESYPRDALFQADAEDLFQVAMGVLALGERQRVRLFVRRDVLNRFAECLVCIPRDRFNTTTRERIANILQECFGAVQVDWALQLSESVLARVHYIVRCPDGVPDVDLESLEARLGECARAWEDALRDALRAEYGEDEAIRLMKRYGQAFPPAYRDERPARSAVPDIKRIEELSQCSEPILVLYRPVDEPEGVTRCKLFSHGSVALSDVLPTFENMGAQVADERPYEIRPDGCDPLWMYDFGLRCVGEDLDRVRELFQDAFLAVRRGEFEDDGFGALVLRAALSGRQVTIIRAIARYLRQAGIQYSDAYMERTMAAHPDVAVMLVELFTARHDPESHDDQRAQELRERIETAIEEVQSLDEDRILRSFLSVLLAILRTNYFHSRRPDSVRRCLSFKLRSEDIPLLPLPRPRFEIFVFSPQVEGVHLRGGKVARGGLRWSDRPEDFRTEVLGLMKAQMVKNALIVPVGSKGGFVVKRPPHNGDRSALNDEAIACYRTFLSGLLDLTDNIVDGDVVAPDGIVRLDEDDPYLVVAADKGTASFSDIANELSLEYGFWLGDAFASGGSHGYDHKQMGITARGAWESVKRHFRELGTDVSAEDFTAVGVGDMSGDVFGNGMLLSRHIKLIAAFNHQHVFIDPDPDPETSWSERKRLFDMGRSGWNDYDESLISEGGGVYSRQAKTIKLSDAVRKALDIDAEELAPAELIRAVLRSPVDLLWNGGIGTYVKAAAESHADAGDKANDPVRVDANELRCRVVGEGGNLGFTPRGRVEFARAGGRLYTDAIDNVAGVNCSDHEVNIKILLGALVAAKEMDEDSRNQLLAEMTESVAERVIYASYTQTQAISLALHQASPMVDVHARLIRYMEQEAGLRRKLEFLPDDDQLAERKSNHEGLTGPELAVVMAYIKIHLYSQLLDSDLPEAEHLGHDLERYFPPPLPERFGSRMRSHRLRREIIATVVANQLVDRAGTTFAFRLHEETGAAPQLLARAYAVAREVFDMRSFWAGVENLDNRVRAETQLDMLIEGRRLVERSSRWLVRTHSRGIDVAACIDRYAKGAKLLSEGAPKLLGEEERERYDERAHRLIEAEVPRSLAHRVASMPVLLAAFDVVQVADRTHRDADTVMATYFGLGEMLGLDWLRDRIIELPRQNRWQALARAALRDDLLSLYQSLTEEVLRAQDGRPDDDGRAAIKGWMNDVGDPLQRCLGMLDDIKAGRVYDTTTLPVALRELRTLVD